MARRKGETQQQHMDRIRATRGLAPLRSREDLFTSVRAAKAYLSTGHYDRPGMELMAFMHIFHPDHPTTGSNALRQTARELDREARG